MNCMDLFNIIKSNGDSAQAAKMSAYMRDQFLFLGIPTPKRKALCRDYFKQEKKKAPVNWDFITSCWEEPYREFQYVAMDYLVLMQKYLISDDVPKIKELAMKKSWWDTIDGLDRVVGNIALVYPEVNQILLAWSKDENLWLRRIAIDHQLTRKDKTDIELMERILVNNLGQSEFFINKAIGWSLRDYSKTNPDWVRNFVKRYQNQLAPLSIKEASKYI
ncbi:DNA alkylation repair protein [Sporomusa termitida]|uniref:DNA alkylation repair enzyme n=1 Tax=Sporomusa termitida TaxID=2377 RepID=A0A517DQF7_9FIRM|nr:DNA alkylation repair protein [Sporomusa termitida]QDR79557.1 DNA alkylation repair enzyme [Sporomusa termitida]